MGIFSRLFNKDEDGAPAEESAGAADASASDGEAPPGPEEAGPAEPEPEPIESVVPDSVEPPTVPRGSTRSRKPPPPRKRKPKKSSGPPPRRAKKGPSLPPLELTDSVFPPRSGDEPESVSIPPVPAAPSDLGGWGAAPEEDPLDDIASELDARFDASRTRSDIPLVAPRESFPDGVTTPDDLGAVRQLFSEMAVPFMSQVRDFMLELRHTDASSAWIDMCEPALASLRATSDQLDMPELARSLDDYVALLAEAKADPSGRVHGETRQQLLDCYQRMTEILPEAFEVGSGREPVIVQLLLLQVPGVHKLTVEKLYKAGVHHFDAFLHAKADELAAVAGIDPEQAQAIIDKFLDYRRRVHSVVTQFMPGEEHENLSRLVAALREQEQAFERARSGWSDDAVQQKRRLRRERGQTVKEIYVALARLGEVDRIDALQKLPVEAQIERLEQFLRATAKQ